jgi:hypothetical protein
MTRGTGTSPLKSYLTEPSIEFGDFVRAHPVADLESPTLDAFVATVAREWIIVTRPSGKTVLAACLQHDRGNPAGAHEVVLLGCSDLDLLAAALEVLLMRAVELARHGGRRRVDLQVPAKLAGIEPKLKALGFRRAWHKVDLELTRNDLCHAVPHRLAGVEPGPTRSDSRRAVPHRLPDGARWQDLGEGTLASARGCYERAFCVGLHDGPPTLTDYSNLALTLMPRARLLMLDGHVIAFTRVVWKDRALGLGEVRNLGRDPDAPQRGLGALALVEALRALGAMGARRAMLTATSCNQRGMSLYKAFGFTETERRGVYHKHLPPRR